MLINNYMYKGSRSTFLVIDSHKPTVRIKRHRIVNDHIDYTEHSECILSVSII